METGSVLSLALGPGPPGLDTSLRVTRGNLEVKAVLPGIQSSDHRDGGQPRSRAGSAEWGAGPRGMGSVSLRVPLSGTPLTADKVDSNRRAEKRDGI